MAQLIYLNFKQREKVSELRIHQSGSYIKTHPATDKRLRSAESFKAKENKKKSLFVIDSAYFMSLKQRCVDESIFVLFNELRFDDCIEKSYKQHVQFPEDPYYVFFLRQSLLRLRHDAPSLSNKQFITHRYIDQKKDPPILPVYSVSRFYKNKPLHFVVRQSIFFYYDDILNINAETLGLTAGYHPLLQHDTLEFINNEDALDYFTTLADKLKCNECFCEKDDFKPITNESYAAEIYASKRQFNASPLYPTNVFVIARYINSAYTPLYNKKTLGGSENIYSHADSDSSFKMQYKLPNQINFADRIDLEKYFL